jgi:hypothetical protein
MQTNTTLTAKSKQLMKAFVPAKVLQSHLHKRVFMQFAEKIGLVYFGYVDQRDDDHRLVRGLTVSASHRDNHYCIGSFRGYDMTLVERVDTLRFPGKPAKSHDWIIMTFDLHAPVDVPHVFIGLHTHSDTFYAHLFTKFSQLAKAPLGTFEAYDPAFVGRYSVYTEPSQYLEAERLFDHAVTKAIAERFGSMTVEVVDGCLYIYAEHQRPTVAFLERMVTCGVWLAQSIDIHMEAGRAD